MVFVNIFSHPILYRYRSALFSKSSFFGASTYVLMVVAPFLVSLKIHGFWLLVDRYREQPVVSLKPVYVMTWDTETQHLHWTNLPYGNTIDPAHVRVPSISTYEPDVNQDSRPDSLHASLCLPLKSGEVIRGVDLLLFFSYRLSSHSTLLMEGLVRVHHSSVVPGASLKVLGDLTLHQRRPLAHRGIDDIYDKPIVDAGSFDARDYQIATILESYWERNVTTTLSNVYLSWSPLGEGGEVSEMCVEVRVRYIEDEVWYRPGWPQVFLQAWIHYLAVFIVFNFVFYHVRLFVFRNQLVHTITCKEKTL